MNRKLALGVLIVLAVALVGFISRDNRSRRLSMVGTPCCDSSPTGKVVTIDMASTDSPGVIYVGPGQWLKWTTSRGAKTVALKSGSEELFGIANARIKCRSGACTWTRVQCSAPEGGRYATTYTVSESVTQPTSKTALEGGTQFLSSTEGTIEYAGPIIIVCEPGKDCSPDTTSGGE